MTLGQKTLAGLVVFFAALHLIGTGSHNQRNYEFLPDMVDPVPYESQGENPLQVDGKTLQAPPEGTIPRGLLTLHVGETMLNLNGNWKELSKEQQAAWDAFKPPAPKKKKNETKEDKAAQTASLERGRLVYERICSTCHGQAGAGDGLATKRGVPPPPSLKADAQKALSDGRMFRVITRGEGNMPSHAIQVSRKDRWKVIRFVRTLQ